MRDATFSAWQPKATLRYKPTDNLTFYGGWSRGFRSGGFNQTGVGAVAAAEGQLGVHDLFQAEIADTFEVGVKSQFLDRRLSVNAALFHTDDHNGYFFFYSATTSTQNLGNLNATYKGAELELTAKATDRLDLYANFGYTDGRITAMQDPTVIGNKPPLLDEGHRQRRRPVPPAAQRRAQRRGAPRLSGNRPHLVGPVQRDLARSGQSGRPARRCRGGAVDGDRLVQESDQQDLQRGVLPGRLPLASPAAPLRSRFHFQVLMQRRCAMAQSTKLPTRLHHTAYVTRDQEKNRQFYEEVIGLPLMATWCESDELFGRVRTYCIPSTGSATAERSRSSSSPIRGTRRSSGRRCHRLRFITSPCGWISATQAAIEQRIAEGGNQAAADLCPRARLLPLGVRDRSQRTDPGVHARPSGGATRSRAIGAPTHTRSSSAGWQATIAPTTPTARPLEPKVDMRDAKHRILTTHVGSLPRSQAVTDVLFARERGEARDAARDDAVIAQAVAEVVRRQVDVGIDVVSDGEMSKISYATYIAERFTGFAGDTPREPGQDLVEFPGLLKKLADRGSTAKYRRPRCIGEIRVKNLAPLHDGPTTTSRQRPPKLRRPRPS